MKTLLFASDSINICVAFQTWCQCSERWCSIEENRRSKLMYADCMRKNSFCTRNLWAFIEQHSTSNAPQVISNLKKKHCKQAYSTADYEPRLHYCDALLKVVNFWANQNTYNLFCSGHTMAVCDIDPQYFISGQIKSSPPFDLHFICIISHVTLVFTRREKRLRCKKFSCTSERKEKEGVHSVRLNFLVVCAFRYGRTSRKRSITITFENFNQIFILSKYYRLEDSSICHIRYSK